MTQQLRSKVWVHHLIIHRSIVQQHLAKKHSSATSRSRKASIESCIRIHKEKGTARKTVCHGVDFYLNPAIASLCQEVRAKGETLQFKPAFLADFRYYAIFQSTLIFSTFYQEEDAEKEIVRSVISLDGDATNQVCQDCLENSEFALTITSIHYWLIQQLMRQLRFTVERWTNSVAWLISSLCAAISVLLNLPQFQAMHPVFWLLTVVMSWLLKTGIQYILRLLVPTIHRWLLRQLLFGIFSQKQRFRKMALGLLEWFGI